VGAVLGHMVLGMNLTILSGFGIVALTGVVVNDSLVMLDFINRSYRGGDSLDFAIREAGKARFRPILLTSLTTFAGLTPLLLEQSLQAQFLIPMAVSLAFGVLFATVITLILVPVLYGIYQDLKVALAKAVGKEDAVRAPLGSDPGDDGDGNGDGGDDPDYDTAVGRA
jgi:multidrug efflux pump subunit AcrB